MNTFKTRDEAAAVAKDFTDAIRGYAMLENGRTSLEASAFALGYLESYMAGMIAELPATRRKMVLAEMKQITLQKLNTIKELA
jgi:hypothetical protein